MAQSTQNLHQTGPNEHKRELRKKSTAKLSKGFMDFISMGDAIGYADKMITK